MIKKNNDNMKPHKLKHIPTGLYYKPFGCNSNLSTRGKIYAANTNPLKLNRGTDYIRVSIRKNSAILKKFLEELPELTLSKDGMQYNGKISKSKFEIEFI